MSTSIVSKIRKLLRLAESDNENEAEVAARLADKLMREHAISLAGLDEAALLEEDPVGSHALEVGLTSWRAKLAWAMASQCNVSALRFNRYTDSHPTETDASGRAKPLAGGFKKRVFMIAYGHRSDLEVWGYLYEVAEREYNPKWGYFYHARVKLSRKVFVLTQYTTYGDAAYLEENHPGWQTEEEEVDEAAPVSSEPIEPSPSTIELDDVDGYHGWRGRLDGADDSVAAR